MHAVRVVGVDGDAPIPYPVVVAPREDRMSGFVVGHCREVDALDVGLKKGVSLTRRDLPATMIRLALFSRPSRRSIPR